MSAVYARKPRKLPVSREGEGDEEEDGAPAFMPAYLTGGNRLMEIKSGAEVNREFWSRLQTLTLSLLTAHLLFTAMALSELAGYEVMPVGTWAMLLSPVWFISVGATLYVRRSAKHNAHGSPKQNPIFLMLLFLAMAFSTDLLLLSVFSTSFSDEVEELDDRSGHIRPVSGLLDPRIHSVWNMIMLAMVLVNFVLFALISLVWYWRLLPKFARYVMQHSPGDAEAMAAAAMRGPINGNTRVVVNHNAGGTDELPEEPPALSGADRQTRDEVEARRLAALGVRAPGPPPPSSMGNSYT